MPKNKGTLIIDDSVPKETRENISERVLGYIDQMKTELSEREPILQKRQDFFEGQHHKWTNVIGQTVKQMEGHILAVFNYIYRFCTKLHQSLTNSEPRIKIKPGDEASEVEVVRAEAVEKALYRVLSDNNFFSTIFKRASINQIRDGDFLLGCVVTEDDEAGKHIEITAVEDLKKVSVIWDDASGTSFTGVIFRDMWTLAKIKREFDYDAEAFSDKTQETNAQKGDHLKDQYGMLSQGGSASVTVPTGQGKVPKGEIVDYWGLEVINKKIKVVNLVYINKELVQFYVTDYKKIPKFIGHSFISPGKPWSVSFIDGLIDPQIELNDRSSEEGDLIRIGAYMKFVVVNMPDFDPDSIKPGSGQVIFIEGENADFRPLTMNITPFPSESYINRVLDHLFNLGLPKIALSAGTAPYTGRVGAIQYQPVVDFVSDLRIQWEVVLRDLFRTTQQYFIDYFPEMHPIMREAIMGEDGEIIEGDFIIRDIQFDWDNVLPLSRSDKVVDASTLYDRHAISTSTYLEEAGFRDPTSEIKKLKNEAADPEMMTLREKFSQLSSGALKAQLDAQKVAAQTQEELGAAGAIGGENTGATPASPKPLLTTEQNSGRRGVLTGTGTPTGQTATQKGAVAQATQNINAQQGV